MNCDSFVSCLRCIPRSSSKEATDVTSGQIWNAYKSSVLIILPQAYWSFRFKHPNNSDRDLFFDQSGSLFIKILRFSLSIEPSAFVRNLILFDICVCTIVCVSAIFPSSSSSILAWNSARACFVSYTQLASNRTFTLDLYLSTTFSALPCSFLASSRATRSAIAWSTCTDNPYAIREPVQRTICLLASDIQFLCFDASPTVQPNASEQWSTTKGCILICVRCPLSTRPKRNPPTARKTDHFGL